MPGIRLSSTHGVNPSVAQCFFCLKDKNELVLFGRLPDDAEAPSKVCLNKEPCDECKGYMEKGIILISVDEAKTGNNRDNPYRTGCWAVVTEEYIRRVIQPEKLVEYICDVRFSFVPDDAWDLLGLPRETATEDEKDAGSANTKS